MPANIEIKARIDDLETIKGHSTALSDQPVEVIVQEDTFFNIPNERLKLRCLAPDLGYLIYYARPDRNGPKRSDYQLVETHEPEKLKAVLSLALGVRGVVKKTRTLYMVGQTRIHVDDVEGLGQFLELEVVLREDQTDAEGQAIARDLMSRLGIREDALVEGAYIDLIERGI